jgi:hypothetical protein
MPITGKLAHGDRVNGGFVYLYGLPGDGGEEGSPRAYLGPREGRNQGGTLVLYYEGEPVAHLYAQSNGGMLEFVGPRHTEVGPNGVRLSGMMNPPPVRDADFRVRPIGRNGNGVSGAQGLASHGSNRSERHPALA